MLYLLGACLLEPVICLSLQGALWQGIATKLRPEDMRSLSGAGIDNATGDHRTAVLAREAGLKSAIENSQTGQLPYHLRPKAPCCDGVLSLNTCALPCLAYNSLRAISLISGRMDELLATTASHSSCRYLVKPKAYCNVHSYKFNSVTQHQALDHAVMLQEGLSVKARCQKRHF